MSRFAKGFRIASALCILLNLVVIFVPITVCTQENYPTLTWTTFDYMKSIFEKNLPYNEAVQNRISTGQLIWILGFMFLPIILAVITGIWGMVGNERQIFSSILAFGVMGLYGGTVAKISYLWPIDMGDCLYNRGIACILYIICSSLGCIMAIIALVCTPHKQKIKKDTLIPQVDEIKQEQMQARYNIISEQEKGTQASDLKKMRGVMIGLKGIYADAEIPFKDGEYITLGRFASNNLVFEGQEKISRNHCKIKWNCNTGQYTIIDFSTNGTFINGSSDCLPQNLEIEIMPGTVIAFGDESNTFRLE